MAELREMSMCSLGLFSGKPHGLNISPDAEADCFLTYHESDAKAGPVIGIGTDTKTNCCGARKILLLSNYFVSDWQVYPMNRMHPFVQIIRKVGKSLLHFYVPVVYYNNVINSMKEFKATIERFNTTYKGTFTAHCETFVEQGERQYSNHGFVAFVAISHDTTQDALVLLRDMK